MHLLEVRLCHEAASHTDRFVLWNNIRVPCYFTVLWLRHTVHIQSLYKQNFHCTLCGF